LSAGGGPLGNGGVLNRDGVSLTVPARVAALALLLLCHGQKRLGTCSTSSINPLLFSTSTAAPSSHSVPALANTPDAGRSMPPCFLGPNTSKDPTLAPLLLLKFPPMSLEPSSDLLLSLVSTPFPSLWCQFHPRIDSDLDLAQFISDSPTTCNTYIEPTVSGMT
jgi:hypothetical protein